MAASFTSRGTNSTNGKPGIDVLDVAQGEPSAIKAPRITHQDAVQACARLMNVDAARVEYPGGASRSSVRALAAHASFIVTRRKHPARAELEAGVLRELRTAGAPVPAVLAYDGQWLIQQDLGPRRLSSALGELKGQPLIDQATQAATALLLCQRAAEQSGLARRVAPLGVKQEWIAKLIATPTQVARHLGLPDPAIEAVITPAQLLPRHLAFIKWDARPGNALLTDDGGLAWIDWEHCGARDALDDLAWLLCDEYMPDDLAVEMALLRKFMPLFAFQSKRSIEEALIYLSRFGALHTCMRLYLVLKHKGDGAWWNAEACERTDRIGVTAQAARRLCSRGARWSRRFPGGERMSQFLDDADKRLRAMCAGSTNAAPVAIPDLA